MEPIEENVKSEKNAELKNLFELWQTGLRRKEEQT